MERVQYYVALNNICKIVWCRDIKQDLTNTFRKSLQTTSASPYRIDVTDFVSSIYNLKTVF
ncbi:hypothetical protein A4261_10580 [Streptococcus pneumoniae]|nr:hypothetical protein A4261_10580 [Streptococcus pneumoniae]